MVGVGRDLCGSSSPTPLIPAWEGGDGTPPRDSRDLLIIFLSSRGVRRGPELSSRLLPVTWSGKNRERQRMRSNPSGAIPENPIRGPPRSPHPHLRASPRDLSPSKFTFRCPADAEGLIYAEFAGATQAVPASPRPYGSKRRNSRGKRMNSRRGKKKKYREIYRALGGVSATKPRSTPNRRPRR